MGGAEVLRRWEGFLDALDGDSEEAAIAAAQAYLEEWERVFWHEGPDALGDQVSHQLEFHDHIDPAGEQVYRGPGGLARLRADLGEVAPHVQTTVLAVQRRRERIVVLGHGRTRGHLSGVAGGFEWGVVWTVRERRIVRVDQFDDHAAARAGAGLEG